LKSLKLGDSRSKLGGRKVRTFAVGKLDTFAFVKNKNIVSETNLGSVGFTCTIASGKLLGWK
jgi:hypothetical protein